MNARTTRLALGTAQLGMPYGIANATGQPSLADARKMVETAWSAGVRWFDTAQAYGNSETVLGQALRDVGVADEARIVTKLAPTVDTGSVTAILDGVRASVARLGLERVWGVLLHREEQLDAWSGAIREAFARAIEQGLTDRVGVSVYTPQRALQALQLGGLTALQVQASVFDRRMARAGVCAEAARREVALFIRSVYLQGLVLMPLALLERTMPFAVPAVSRLERFCRGQGMERQEFALRYALGLAARAHVVIGAETVAQTAENCRLAGRPPLSRRLCRAWDAEWPEDGDDLINPSLWPRSPAKAVKR